MRTGLVVFSAAGADNLSGRHDNVSLRDFLGPLHTIIDYYNVMVSS